MKCNLCARECNVQRDTIKGFCGMSQDVYIARSELHMWEEECISGDAGSGTIFFAGCNLKCIYCQNAKISRGEIGKRVTTKELADNMIVLQEKGANNINLVTPTHYVPQIIEALNLARKEGLKLPIVYNTSSYETAETIKMLDGYVDVYLADCKYYDDKLARDFSKAEGYFDVAIKAIDEMVRQCRGSEFDGRGIMQRGVIVRHLILPGHTKDSKIVIQSLYDRYGNDIYISIMNQYTPMAEITTYPELNRSVTKYEYEKVINYALELGIENGFIQEGGTAKESFVPDFNLC